MVEKKEFTYDSRDGKTKIHAIEWTPVDTEIIGVLQIAHGMVEFIDRYDDFARYLADRGLVVVGNDHLGHGTTALSPEDLGFFCEKDGNTIVLRDIHRLKKLTEEKYPGVPYYILGHSMGSFLVRQYLYTYGTGIDGAIITGIGHKPEALLKFGKGLTKTMMLVYGPRYRSKLVDGMAFGGYNKHFKPSRTESDWITKDQGIVDSYVSDEKCTFRFTLKGYYDLFIGMEAASKTANLEKMPKDLPILLASGGEDPVGDFGKAIEKIRRQFKKAGMKDLTWKVYEGDRHEILNELDRDKVYNDIYAWLYVHIAEGMNNRNLNR